MIYLDNAATSFPKPEAVYLKIDEVLRRISGNPGRASHRMAVEASRVIFNAREAAAKLINSRDSSRVVFTKNATEAVNIALKGLLRTGDHAITSSFEHNSVVKTFWALEKTGVSVTKVRPDRLGFLNPEEVRKAIRQETKIVCIAHASNVFGTIQPIKEIAAVCKKAGVIFMADGAQTVGAMEVDVEAMGIDILAATGHKAMFGPQGTGFLYLRKGIEPEALINGGTGEAEAVLEIPERLESGTMNTPGVGGLSAGIEFLLKEGVDNIRRREEKLLERLLSGLGEIKNIKIIGPLEASKRAALIAFNIEGMPPAEAGKRLDDGYGIMVRTGAHCAPDAHREAGTHPDGAVRVSPGYFTTDEEIEIFLKAIKEIAG